MIRSAKRLWCRLFGHRFNAGSVNLNILIQEHLEDGLVKSENYCLRCLAWVPFR